MSRYLWAASVLAVIILGLGFALMRKATPISLAILGGATAAAINFFATSKPTDAPMDAAVGSLLGIVVGGIVGMIWFAPRLNARGFRRASGIVAGAAVPVTLLLAFLSTDVVCPRRYGTGPKDFCDICIVGQSGQWPVLVLVPFFADIVAMTIFLVLCASTAERAENLGRGR